MLPMDRYRISFFGGTASGLLPNLPVEDLVVTLVMAAMGAIASYVVTELLRQISNWFKSR
tara:strand:- start:15446 stop:15625 length:180 start_codon:yes stop_codon:yes gene_type:complete